MNKHLKRYSLIGFAVLIVLLALFAFERNTSQRDPENLDLLLKAPLFVEQALADNSEIGQYLDDEAGISAWFQGDVIDLDDVRPLFRTIELETPEYIIGSVPVPDYNELEDVHAYVHVDGWVLAYYLNPEPVSKIVDMYFYETNGNITTKFATVLDNIASAAGSPFMGETYYDFRYPNATHMMIIAETLADPDSEGTFIVELPLSFAYYERGYSLSGNGFGDSYAIDGVTIVSCRYCYGTLSAPQLTVGTPHTISINNWGALVLVYREQ